MQIVPEQPLDMVASLESGQAHRWKKEDGWHTSVVQGNYIKIRQTDDYIEYHCAPNSEESILPLMRSYFRMDDDLDYVYSEITRDDRVATMVDRYPGLRLLRQEPWECFLSLIHI